MKKIFLLVILLFFTKLLSAMDSGISGNTDEGSVYYDSKECLQLGLSESNLSKKLTEQFDQNRVIEQKKYNTVLIKFIGEKLNLPIVTTTDQPEEDDKALLDLRKEWDNLKVDNEKFSDSLKTADENLKKTEKNLNELQKNHGKKLTQLQKEKGDSFVGGILFCLMIYGIYRGWSWYKSK